MPPTISYSQNREDIFLERMFEGKSDGFYIDLGAAHPLNDSVTALFYLKGWQGINVEPDRRFLALLQEMRERDINLDICVGKNSGSNTLYTSKVLGWSTTAKTVAEKFETEKSISYEVQTRTLDFIFDMTENEIHFLKIDCEGSELDILESSQFDKKRPWVIAVEIVKPHSDDLLDTEIQSYLENRSYELVHFDGLNGFFVDSAKKKNFDKKNFRPVSVLDEYITYGEKVSTEQLNQTTEQLNQTTEQLNQTTEQLNQTTEQKVYLIEKLEKTNLVTRELEREIHSYKMEINRMTHSASWLLTKPLRSIKQSILKISRFNVLAIILFINNSSLFRNYLLRIINRVKPLRKFSKRLLAKARIRQVLGKSYPKDEKIYLRSNSQIWQQLNPDIIALPAPNIDRKKPLLTICVSTYNRARWLKHSIPHLLEATKKYGTLIEVLIVDNASIDESSIFLNDLKSSYHFNLIINPINVGMLGNLAVTANAANGEFTWILGDDDFINPASLENVLKIIWKHPGINLIYGNYSHINFEADEFRGYSDLVNNATLIEPESESYYVGRIIDMASKTENFFTAIYCCIFRTDHAQICFKNYDEDKPFESLEACVPTTKYVLETLTQEPGYWYGESLITVNTNVSWLKYADLWVIDRFPEIYNGFESAGVPRNEIDKYRIRSMDGVKFHLEDALNKSSSNLAKIQLHHLFLGYSHLVEFKQSLKFFGELLKETPRLEKIYSEFTSNSVNQNHNILVEGPFIGSYSLARVNRGVAKALSRFGEKVHISPSPTEGPNFSLPKEFQDQEILKMYSVPKDSLTADILIRNTFPPTVENMKKEFNFYHSFGWEESEFPSEYIQDFNLHLDGITVMSSYVKKALLDNGLRIPIEVTGLGIDFVENLENQHQDEDVFRFLSVSSAFPRKGIDILIKAFAEEFNSSEGVELVLKSFPNIHNDLQDQIAKIRKTSAKCPTILLINEDFESDVEIGNLYKSADIVVAPSRGEGFGWAIGEALAYGIPVIATGYGGHLEILDSGYPWLIDFEFDYSNSHFGQNNSIWVEPNLEHLKKLMRSAFETPKKTRIDLGKRYGEKAIKSNNWEETALRIEKFISRQITGKFMEGQVSGKNAILTTWREQCGIAEYSNELLKNEKFSDSVILSRFSSPTSPLDDAVIECWKEGNVDRVLEVLREANIKSLIVQYQPSFFSLYELSRIVSESSKIGIEIFIILHNVTDFCGKISRDMDPIFGKKNVHLLVHTASDLNLLKRMKPEFLDRTIHFPHPNYTLNFRSLHDEGRVNPSVTISSFGFLHENKGTDLLINVFEEIKKKYPTARLNLINAHLDDRSTIYKGKCIKLIEEKGLSDSIFWTSEFLSYDEIQAKLSSSDLIILPYRESTESSSGAVRICMTSQIPILVSTSSIFSDVANVVLQSDIHNLFEFTKKAFEILENSEIRFKAIESQNNFMNSYSFKKMSEKLFNIIQASSSSSSN